MMVCETQNCWVSGLCPLSGILNTRKHNNWTGPISVCSSPNHYWTIEFEVEVNLRPTISRSIRLGVGPLFGTDDQILISFSDITFFLHVKCPLWREDGSVICSAITYRLESRRTYNHILLFHLRPSPPAWRARSPHPYALWTEWPRLKSKSRYDRRSISMSWCLAHAAS
jgi:hypothetical protein